MRFIAILGLVLLYLLPSIGLTISKHYCGGELSSISAIPFHEHSCGCGDNEMGKDCCKDELTLIKIEDEQSKTQNSEIAYTYSTFSNAIYFKPKTNVFFSFIENCKVLEDPPDKAISKKIFIKIQSFLI